jgi:Tfp pilus assembly protein PilP
MFQKLAFITILLVVAACAQNSMELPSFLSEILPGSTEELFTSLIYHWKL